MPRERGGGIPDGTPGFSKGREFERIPQGVVGPTARSLSMTGAESSGRPADRRPSFGTGVSSSDPGGGVPGGGQAAPHRLGCGPLEAQAPCGIRGLPPGWHAPCPSVGATPHIPERTVNAPRSILLATAALVAAGPLTAQSADGLHLTTAATVGAHRSAWGALSVSYDRWHSGSASTIGIGVGIAGVSAAVSVTDYDDYGYDSYAYDDYGYDYGYDDYGYDDYGYDDYGYGDYGYGYGQYGYGFGPRGHHGHGYGHWKHRRHRAFGRRAFRYRNPWYRSAWYIDPWYGWRGHGFTFALVIGDPYFAHYGPRYHRSFYPHTYGYLAPHHFRAFHHFPPRCGSVWYGSSCFGTPVWVVQGYGYGTYVRDPFWRPHGVYYAHFPARVGGRTTFVDYVYGSNAPGRAGTTFKESPRRGGTTAVPRTAAVASRSTSRVAPAPGTVRAGERAAVGAPPARRGTAASGRGQATPTARSDGARTPSDGARTNARPGTAARVTDRGAARTAPDLRRRAGDAAGAERSRPGTRSTDPSSRERSVRPQPRADRPSDGVRTRVTPDTRNQGRDVTDRTRARTTPSDTRRGPVVRPGDRRGVSAPTARPSGGRTVPARPSDRARPAPDRANPGPSRARPAPSTSRPAPSRARPDPATSRPRPSTARPAPSRTREAPSRARPSPSRARQAPSRAAPSRPSPPNGARSPSSRARPSPPSNRARPAPAGRARPAPSQQRTPSRARPAPSRQRAPSGGARPAPSRQRAPSGGARPAPSRQPAPSRARPAPSRPTPPSARPAPSRTRNRPPPQPRRRPPGDGI